ncbi:hypothetical protein M3Y99_00927100 [Aphelenchoides fujianensis]|nr:hypothetical protein M3Y99_00927100 [Aphelenchoides fujianensis]
MTTSAPFDQSDVLQLEKNFDVQKDAHLFRTSLCERMADRKVDCFCTSGGVPFSLPTIPTTTNGGPTTTAADDPADPCEKPTDPAVQKFCGILEDGPINSTNINDKVDETKGMIKADDTTAADLHVVSEILVGMANVKDANPAQRKNVLGLVDNALGVKADSFGRTNRQTKERFLDSIHTIAANSDQELEYLDGDQFGLRKTAIDCSQQEDGGHWAGIVDDGQKFGKAGDSSAGVASIELDKRRLCDEKTGTSRGVYFVIFRNSKLFDDDESGEEDEQQRSKRSLLQSNEQTTAPSTPAPPNPSPTTDRCKPKFHETNGLVLTSVLLDGSSETGVNARVRFKKEGEDQNLPAHSSLVVTWWDQTEWAAHKQCEIREEDGEWVAHCDHLTNFALLVQKSETDPLLCDFFLDRLGFWLTIASATCLFLLALIYTTRVVPKVRENILIRMLNNSLRPSADSFIILYVFLMLFFFFFFVAFIDESVTGSAVFCKLTAAFLYFLFLAALIVNLFQAWNLIRVCAWSSRMEFVLGWMTRVWIALPIALIVPLVVCLTLWFVDTGFFYRGDQYCWIRPESVLFAVLIPVSIMLLNSFVTFAIFCLRMFPAFSRLFRLPVAADAVRMSSGAKRKRRGRVQLFVAVLFAQFVLGFPWLLQYPAMFSAHITVWHYLFAILNGSNGVILLLMYVYGRAVAFHRVHTLNTTTSQSGPSKDSEEDEW